MPYSLPGIRRRWCDHVGSGLGKMPVVIRVADLQDQVRVLPRLVPPVSVHVRRLQNDAQRQRTLTCAKPTK